MEAPAPPSPALPPRPLWRRALGERPDETLLRAVLRTLLVLAVAVVVWDFHERKPAPPLRPGAVPAEVPAVPYLPSARPGVKPPGEDRPGRSPDSALRQPMTLELLADGRLEATGTLTPGTAERFAAELDKRGSYVKTVVLNSPGGSVSDALTMGRAIRARGLDTRVEAKGLCASSCPLIFASGVTRTALPGAAIGVHQVFAALPPGAPRLDGAEGMAQAQRVSAEAQRHLVEMGVDPRVWISAMETPPQEMFYFTAPELSELKLVTSPS
ncbi:ATP-dependent Clp protease proteolytic subunit [Ancylobacter sp. IITR112]|uniref:ATP-dependent Clp protease proteolytic subunit n=1 Tax=Ancylobacter sp. IITR112 TaxID=3138073 RepID=UPI00352B2AF6